MDQHQTLGSSSPGGGKASPPELAASKKTTGDESMPRPQQPKSGLEILMDLPLESEDDGESRPEGALDEAGSPTAIFANDQSSQLADSAPTPNGPAFVTADEVAPPAATSQETPQTTTETGAAADENGTLVKDGVAPMNVDGEQNEHPVVEKLLGENWQNGLEAFMEGGSSAPSDSLSIPPTSGDEHRATAASASSGIPAQPPTNSSSSSAFKGRTATQMQHTYGKSSENEARMVSTSTITNNDIERADNTNAGGVFDDAEDEGEIVPAAARDEEKEQAAPSATTHSSGLKASRLQEIREIVFRPQPREAANTRTASAANPSAKSAEQSASSSTTSASNPSAKSPVEKAAKKKLDKKRKGPNKPMKRFLFAKKESDQATQLLQGKGDLADCLSVDDCLFLGKHFWIFTVEQLAATLNIENTSAGSEGKLLDRITAALVRRYQEGLSKEKVTLKASGLLAVARDSQPKADTPIETSSRKDACDLSEPLTQSTSDGTAGLGSSAKSEQPAPAPEPAPSVDDVGPESADSSSNGNGMRLDDPLLHQKAYQTIGGWRESVEKFQREATKEDGAESRVKKKFKLENAIKYLFPMATRNFLKSIKVGTLWSFLSLKKTETGAVCELIEMWRKECGLPPVPQLGLTKHLSGVATRVESALSAVPCVTEDKREWMKDPIIGLTGAAREFLVVDQGFVSASEFASRPTKDVANELEKWREKKGMEPLKGTGKIANISTWKAQAKEAVESEAGAGRVVEALPNAFSGNTLNVDHPDPVVSADVSSLPPPKKRKKKSTRAPPSSDSSVEYAFHSKMFLEDTLGEEVAGIIAKAGVKTAAELFDAETKRGSTLYRALLDAGKANSEVTFKRVIDIWRGKLRKDLDQLGLKALGENPQQPEQTVSETSSKRPRSSPSETMEGTIDDPLDALSPTTMKFLNSIGIMTAAELLTTRTTDISSDFVKWRVAEGKPELRGMGAIASVSGWKSAVRNRAKELGLDQISELEPKRKAMLNSQAPSPKRAKRTKQESGAKNADRKKKDFINQMRRAPRVADSTLPPGKGLHEDGRKLFAVQHRELPGHFVFVLSLRNRGGDVSSASEIYATYRGFGPRSGITEKASKVRLQLANAEPDDVENEMPNYTLVDVSVNRNVASTSSTIDPRIPFSASRPGCGLLEIGKHGGYPYKKQDLSPLKTAIEYFVLNDSPETSSMNGDTSLPDENCNVLIEKVGHDNFNFLLYLQPPIEQGQTVAVVFPSLASTLRSRKYDDTEFRTRHIIDEATRTLSLDDLRSLLTWLHDEVLRSTGYSEITKEETNGNDFDFKVACERRRRLCWVCRRIYAAIGGSRVSPEDTKLCFMLEFGRKTRENNDDWSKFSQQQKADFVAVIRSQLLLELRFTLELDVTCGTGQRIGWCPRSLKLFNAVVECTLQSYFFTLQSNASTPDCRSALCSSLAAVLITNISSTDFTNADMLGDFVVHQNSSCSSDGRVRVPGIDKEAEQGYLIAITKWNETAQDLREAVPDNLGSVACIGEKRDNEPFSVVMRNPGDVRSGRAYLSSDWYRCHFWRIVAAVLSAFRGNLAEYSEVSAYEFDKVLSLAGPLVISREAFRSKPVAVSYEQQLRLPQIDVKDDYALPSEPLFLGLVWPALRDCGWQLEVGDTPSEVYFHPKTHARKQSFDLKRRRNYDRMLLKKEISKAGLRHLTKPSKRLLVAVAASGIAEDNVDQNGAIESSTQIDPRSSTTSVAGILQSFNTFLVKKVLEKGGPDQSAKFSAVLESVGKCFDSLAHHLPPIQGLKGAVEVGEGQRPIDIYSCEYLLQFLFLLPDALKQESLPEYATRDVLEIVRDLFRFTTAKHQELLAKRSQLPREHYVVGDDDLSSPQMFLESKLAAVVPDRAVVHQQGENEGHKAGSGGAPTNWLPDRDQAGVTDFIFTTYQHTMPCRATAEDTRRKGRRGVTVGFPGLCCRHCLGMHGEGRYFFSSLESLASSYNGFEKHFLRCSMVPAEIKEKITFTRSQHAQQRTGLKFGSQHSFFNRMWEWLHSSKSAFPDVSISGDAGQQYGTTLSVHRTLGASNKEAFSDHIAVLDHLRSNKVSAEVEEALDRYYSALDYAGRVYNTSAMPEHFTSEWLLAKMSPKNVHHAMRNVG